MKLQKGVHEERKWLLIRFVGLLGECVEAYILEGFNTSIQEGVHLISVFLGGYPIYYFEDALSIVSFDVVKKGITVVFSTDGPNVGRKCLANSWEKIIRGLYLVWRLKTNEWIIVFK
ncbi:hypothetical protein L6452_42750 [Arctium lappa]|uniref:Uncharacterized protein n=1 Tax=Arctium lappa TaxID=4217 RepID=A0ACB8XN86_ARCLA|nr:hypothetical protein L6452_42750 [Arctium lappa]